MDRLHAEDFPLGLACDLLGVSRSGYYAYRRHALSARQLDDRQLRPLLIDLFWRHKRRYGARRIAFELTIQGHACGVKRVGRMMRELGLKAIQPRSFKPRTTESRHRLGYSRNLLLESPMPWTVNQVWVADITYIPLKSGGFAYLALLLDLCSRRIVGWQLADHMTETLTLAVLRQAIAGRQPPPGLLHHSDRGGQYAGREYRQVLARARMLQSMSRKANCYDNAFMESCFGTIKRELEMTAYLDEPSARREIQNYIRYYNLERRHSSINYLTPEQFERGPTAPK